MPAAACRRVLRSRTATAAVSLLAGGAAGAACQCYASSSSSAPNNQGWSRPDKPSAMEMIRQRAGMEPGTDPWGKPMERASRRRLAEVDVYALSESRAPSPPHPVALPASWRPAARQRAEALPCAACAQRP